METKSNKIVGYALLALGLAVIFFGIYSSYNIFAAKKDAPQVFKYDNSQSISSDSEDSVGVKEEIVVDRSRLTDPNYVKNLEDQQRAMAENLVKDQIGGLLKEIIPQEFIIKLLNLSSWSIFVFILIFAGGKISGLGIKLLKD
ncbi:hypothetical protein KAJ41_01935 [Candidatus Parcubacteria bacterium]|nr:hypothetical protein [Candidatus Parcubacteria bacterium]